MTESVFGGRKAMPSTLPKFLLDRLGFCSTASCQMALECEFFSQYEDCQNKHFDKWECPLRVVSFELDYRATDVTRFIPISSKDFRPNFVWKDMTLVWVEEFNDLMKATEKRLFENQVPPRDRQHHRTKVCYVQGCKGTVIMGG